MKLSKAAKARIRRMSASERKAILKAAQLLADVEIITADRYAATYRTLNTLNKMC
tara:strand:- start:3775 stop:3939 length:165 start_codon:yes stop_codon:yes gene_type:complete